MSWSLFHGWRSVWIQKPEPFHSLAVYTMYGKWLTDVQIDQMLDLLCQDV